MDLRPSGALGQGQGHWSRFIGSVGGPGGGRACRAEKSFTHRHLCEFTGLDFEMQISEHYDEVLDVIDMLFTHVFEGLNKQHGEPLPLPTPPPPTPPPPPPPSQPSCRARKCRGGRAVTDVRPDAHSSLQTDLCGGHSNASTEAHPRVLPFSACQSPCACHSPLCRPSGSRTSCGRLCPYRVLEVFAQSLLLWALRSNHPSRLGFSA